MKATSLRIIGIACGMLSLFSASPAKAQGCSDAGFCTVGNLSLRRADSTSRGQKFTLSLPFGKGDEDVFVLTPGLQYDNRLSEQWSVQARITSNYAQGNLGTAVGLGDIFLSGTRIVKNKNKWETAFTLGTKLPLNLGNIKAEGKSLPMQYQSSLGTIDLIAGISLTNQSWQLAAGWQQPLSGINRNNFLPVYWNTPEAVKYPPSNDFDRRGDLLLRVAYQFTTRSSFTLNTGLLAIYHLGEDTYVDSNVSISPIPITGSQGLTLNATLFGLWKVNDKISFGLTAGVPLIVRDVRPDGLTRSFVVSPELRWNF